MLPWCPSFRIFSFSAAPLFEGFLGLEGGASASTFASTFGVIALIAASEVVELGTVAILISRIELWLGVASVRVVT